MFEFMLFKKTLPECLRRRHRWEIEIKNMMREMVEINRYGKVTGVTSKCLRHCFTKISSVQHY